MLMMFATLALLTLYACLGVGGVLLLRRPGRRVAGAVLLAQALLLLGAQIALSTLPFGIGEPLIRVRFTETLLQAALALAAVLGVGVLAWWAGPRLAARLAGMRRPGLAAGALLALLPLLAAAGMAGMVRASLPERERERDPRKRQIALPPGFQWSVYAQGAIDNPTTIAFGPDGRLYIGDIAGSLWVASDGDGDGQAETVSQWAGGFDLLVGLAWRGDELFTSSSGKIEALRDSDGDGQADQRRTVVEGLPSMVLRPHSNNALAFGPDGRLYFGVGSTTSGDYEPEPLAASVLSVNPDGSDLQVFARGFGNTFGVAFNRDGQLFGGDNSPGGEDEPDEFNHIIKDGHYGYPYFYGDPAKNNGTVGALGIFPAHSSPTGMSFYSGDTFPQEYRDSAFVALWARGDLARVEVARTSGGQYLSRVSTFGTGFLSPIGAITGPDGNLYVADFGTSAVYRITYE
ncbi:MAG TPA: PQQ-dependent sugar dehydrogenase [Roseiflexaceae bacterium]|nr:PQQ-dependent sugar dehydrogenase [Roseiflexaceae bacterium]